MSNSETSVLEQAFLQPTVTDETKTAVKAEDLDLGGNGIEFLDHFFEPQPGHSYTIKFISNPGGEALTHRSKYGKLPDPERKGKTFQYVSSGDSSTCKALELFFDLHALKKNGDTLAELKIKNFLSRTQQAAVKVQILKSSDEKYKVGDIRIFAFSTYGQNAAIANLIDQKLNPTPEMIADGDKKEDIYNVFSASVLSLICNKADFDGQEGREYSKSTWLKTKRGAIGIIVGDTGEPIKAREFTAEDYVNGALSEEAKPFFMSFIKHATDPKYDIHTYFAYKKPGDAKNNEETEKYIQKVFKKVDEIIPIIRNAKSIEEITAYGKADTSAPAEQQKQNNAKNIMAESIPDELKNSTMVSNQNVATEEVQKSTQETKTETPKTETPNGVKSVADILNS